MLLPFHIFAFEFRIRHSDFSRIRTTMPQSFRNLRKFFQLLPTPGFVIIREIRVFSFIRVHQCSSVVDSFLVAAALPWVHLCLKVLAI